MCKVSVVVPIYNSENTLRQCIDSIILQSYSNIEIILVNDGSEDRSRLICEEYKKKDRRIQNIDQKNSGVSEARNSGINKATGEYILFVDSDDNIDRFMIEKLVKVAKRDLSELVVSGFKEFNIERFSYRLIGTCEYGKNITLSQDGFFEIFSDLYRKRLLSGPCNSLYNLNIIKNNNIYFDRNLSYGEDTLFNMKYLKSCRVFSIVNESFYNYVHVNPFSLSQRYNQDKLNSVNMIYNKIRELIATNKLYYDKNIKEIEYMYFCHIIKCVEELVSNSKNKSIRGIVSSSKDILSDLRILNAVKYRETFNNYYYKILANLNRLHMYKIEFVCILLKSYYKKFLFGALYGRQQKHK